LDDARRTAAEFAETLHSDLGIQTLAFSYSGRGFHLRALDDEVMKLEQTERSKLVEYITGSVIPGDLMLALGYSKVFRERMIRTLKYLNEHKLSQVIRRSAARRIIQEKEKAMQSISARRIQEFRGLGEMGDKTFIKLMEFFARTNSEFTDGKVTVDTKRILRLPSTLHSGVSMKCTIIRDIERFSLDDAIPKFMRE
jgi:DNA primase small subunit